MIKRETNWEDSGYDCQHCGVQILKRIDSENGRPAQICFQGERGCQWSVEGELIHIGDHPQCQRAHRQRRTAEIFALPRWVWAVVLLFFLLTALRFGGFVALRFLVPLFLAILAASYAFQFGRRKEWW